MPDNRIVEIKQKVSLLLEDDSLGAVGKKFDHDHHVTLRTKLYELLEEDVPHLLQQNEQQQVEIERLKTVIERNKEQRHMIRAELHRSREEAERLRGEQEQWKVVVDKSIALNEPLQVDRENLMVERDDYRKVLEWYSNARNYDIPDDDDSLIAYDNGHRARDILYRYERGDSQQKAEK